MRRLLLLVLSISAASGCASSRSWSFTKQYFSGPAPRVECSSDADGMRLCRYEPKSGPIDPTTVVFFLHYATGDEGSFGRIGIARAFYARYAKRRKPAPRVIALSYGTHWILSREPGKRQIVPLAPFLKKLAALEPRAKRRYVWGMSMGGYNAAEAVLSGPSAWSGVVLQCPALPAGDPFDAGQAPALLQQPGADESHVRDGLALLNTRLAGPEAFKREDPAALARQNDGPTFLIEANRKDEFGFLAGARALDAALRAGGTKTVYRELPGGHCVVDGADAADFFLGLP